MIKYLPGVIPVIALLVAVGVLIAGGAGVYVVRNQFVKTSPDEKPQLDVGKINEQIANPEELPPASPNVTGPTATGPFTYTPKDAEESNETGSDEPGFTITPPAGWQETSSPSSSVKAAWISPTKDKEDLDDPLTFSQPASIQVSYNDISTLGTSDLEEIVKAVVSAQGLSVISNEATTLGESPAQYFEGQGTSNQGIEVHSAGYSVIVNNYLVTAMGVSLESAWSANSGILDSSLSSLSVN